MQARLAGSRLGACLQILGVGGGGAAHQNNLWAAPILADGGVNMKVASGCPLYVYLGLQELHFAFFEILFFL